MKPSQLFLCSLFSMMMSISHAEDAKTSSPALPPATPAPSKEEVAPPATPQANPMVAQGKELHEKTNCKSCHQPELYTRPTRKMKSYDSLKTQVQTCATSLSIPWFEDEVESVAAYLNADYYKFETK